MTPKEKAKELVEMFTSVIWESGSQVSKPLVKQCALICVNEIMGLVPHPMNPLNDEDFDYWQQVKTSIESL